ncbi:hypothetical protein BH09ACT12_BH09ACT12_27460 [soil metagenome]
MAVALEKAGGMTQTLVNPTHTGTTTPAEPDESPDVVPSMDPDQPSADPQTQPAPAPEGS